MQLVRQVVGLLTDVISDDLLNSID